MKAHTTLRLAAALGLIAPIAAHGLVINEIRIDEPGTDVNEYMELKGDPGTSLDDVWYIVIGDHSNFGNPDQDAPNYRGGVVEYAIDLSGFVIPDDGLFLISRGDLQIDPLGIEPTDIDYLVSTIIFENSDNVTHLLVRGYTGTEVTQASDQWGDLAVDIDPFDDGLIVDPLPWAETIDAIGLIEIPNDSPDVEEFVYGELLGFEDIGPDRTFTPGHVYRGANDNQWNIGQFGLLNDDGTALQDGAVDTPGKPNPDSPDTQPVETPVVNYYSPTLVKAGETVTVVGQLLQSVTEVRVGEIAADFSAESNFVMTVTIPEGAISGDLISLVNEGGFTQADAPLTLIPDDLGIVVREDFEADLGDFTEQSITSNYTWRHRTFSNQGFAEMSGFNADEASEDWLISPAINLAGWDTAALEFTTARNFSGPDLEVKIATDFDGDVETATWTDITGITLSTGGYEQVKSGAVDLAAYLGETVHVAFRYTSEGPESDQGATYQVHDFLVTGTGGPVAGLWANASDLGDGWFDTWVSLLHAADAPYYFDGRHNEWLYIDPTSTDAGAYIISFGDNKWVWTSESLVPYYYEFSETGGAWVLPGDEE
jgi:hypothetical protein